MLNEEKWRGYEQEGWSGKRSPDKWYPHFNEKLVLIHVEDSTSGESTNINFEFNDITGKVNRISNEGQASNREIQIRIKKPNNWLRSYIVTPDKDGEDFLSIDHPVTVRNFLLIKDKGKWKLEEDILIMVDNKPK